MNNERYVAQLRLPASAYVPTHQRHELSPPTFFGVIRGYWQPSFDQDRSGSPRPNGLLLTVEYNASDLQSAEDTALRVGHEFTELLAMYSGSPLETPFLGRVARIGAGGGVWSQSVYFYEDDPRPRAPLTPTDLDMIVHRLATIPADRRERISLAVRWYASSIGAWDSLDAYLAIWIGLESLGSALSERYHLNGARAGCQTCAHQPGVPRDRTIAGIQHATAVTAPEILTVRSVQDLAILRNEIAHALKPADTLRATVQAVLLDLQVVLGRGILSVLAGATTAVQWKALMPRDYERRPDARATVNSSSELTEYRPYLGDWIKVERSFPEWRSWIEEDGTYVVGNSVSLVGKASITGSAPEQFAFDYVAFTREGQGYEPKGEPAVPQVTWRREEVPESWKQFRTPRRDTDTGNRDKPVRTDRRAP